MSELSVGFLWFVKMYCFIPIIENFDRLAAPKNDTSTEVQEKVLTLIQTWADAFQKHPDLQGVSEVYQELKLKGVEFPMTNLDTMAPVVTPHNHKVCKLAYQCILSLYILEIKLHFMFFRF